jgi:trans-2,3-dihydro-3-hydroxyanthranilate isomerase
MQFFIVDVFAEQKYQGNQLAVFAVDRDLASEEMQQIAREMHFSESTFILSRDRRDGAFDVRIFTPDMEVPFAGHPTLGTAFVLREILGWERADRVVLNLGVGPIPVDFRDGILTMEQKTPVFGPVIEDRQRIADILGIPLADLEEKLPIQVVSTGLPAVIVPLRTRDAVARCAIRAELYQRFLDDTAKAAICAFTGEAEHAGNDFRVRVFVDDPGFFEDPATGSANGNLAGYLLEHGYFDRTDVQYRVEQGYEMGRPSLLYVAAMKNERGTHIRVGGRVFRVAEGRWD